MSGAPTTRALALDQAPRATGWAFGEIMEKKPTYGLFKLDSWNEAEGARMHLFYEWLNGLIRLKGITHLFYEAPVNYGHMPKNFDVTVSQGMQIGCIELVAYRCNLETYKIDVTAMRKRFFGTSKGPRDWLKEQAVRACHMRGWYVDDDNVAEALGLLDFGLSSLSKQHAGASDVLFHKIDLHRSIKKFRGELDVIA
jgi:hypothetical protein